EPAGRQSARSAAAPVRAAGRLQRLSAGRAARLSALWPHLYRPAAGRGIGRLAAGRGVHGRFRGRHHAGASGHRLAGRGPGQPAAQRAALLPAAGTGAQCRPAAGTGLASAAGLDAYGINQRTISRQACQLAWATSGNSTPKPTKKVASPTPVKNRISPAHSAIAFGLAMIARRLAPMAETTSTSRFSSSGREIAERAKVSSAKP